MRLVNQIPERNIRLRIAFICLLSIVYCQFSIGQDNSPYSRYGIGDIQPNTNILNRGMAGISAAYTDQLSVNFTNPASYSRFFSLQEGRSKKSAYGRILLDVGLNFDRRTLQEPSGADKFTAPNAYFSYLQLGIPLKKNLGIVFGLRPISYISYNIQERSRLFDPITNVNIDSALTEYKGDGGVFAANTGLGFAIKNFSIGFNTGYLFGNKDFSTHRILLSDSVEYASSNSQTQVSIGGFFFNAGMQYRINLNSDKTSYFQLGAYGNVKHDFNTEKNVLRETYIKGTDGGVYPVDSISFERGIEGKMTFPATFGGGFLFERLQGLDKSGILLGVDFNYAGWDDYRFNGQKDSVKTAWQFRIGGQLKPAIKESKYKNLITYRGGIFFGQNYVYLDKKLPEWGITAGLGLPIANLKDASRRFRTQYSIVNISAEYMKRGNSQNQLLENHFRISVGFTLSDLWFTKRKYE